MVDEPQPADAPDPAPPRCPWCAAVADPAADVCPACGAHLLAGAAQVIPGVTEVDALALARRPLPTATASLGALLMGGVDVERPTAAELPAIAPPDLAVRREMLRLELDARRVELEQEAGALAAEEHLRLLEAQERARPREATRLPDHESPQPEPAEQEVPGAEAPAPADPTP